MQTVNIKLVPNTTSNPIINQSTNQLQHIFRDVVHDTYDYTITSDYYETETGTIIVDKDMSRSIELRSKPVYTGSVLTGIGDSITYGRLDTSTGRMTTPWLTTVGNNIGADEVINLGISSSLIATKPTNAIVPIVNRISDIPPESSIIFLQGGTNDYASGVVMGTINDTSTETFYGALNKYYGTVKTNHPNASIIVITMPETTAMKGGAWSKQQYVDAQIAVANKFGLEIFDAFSLSMVTPELADMADGVHMSQSDANIFAQELTDFLNGTFESGRDTVIPPDPDPEPEPTENLVWDTSVNGYSAVPSVNSYIRTATVQLIPNTLYKVTTDSPKLTTRDQASIYPTTDEANLIATHLLPNEELLLTTTASGKLFISCRPAQDFEGTTWSPNEVHLINGTYKVQVFEVE